MTVYELIMKDGKPDQETGKRLATAYGNALNMWSIVFGIDKALLMAVPGEEKLDALMRKDIKDVGDGLYMMDLDPETDPIITRLRKDKKN